MTARLVWAKQNICTNALYFKKKRTSCEYDFFLCEHEAYVKQHRKQTQEFEWFMQCSSPSCEFKNSTIRKGSKFAIK